MKHIYSKILGLLFPLLIIPLTTLVAQEHPLRLTYTIRPTEKNEKPALEVEAEFEGNDDGTTEILLPSSWAGQEDLYRQISIIESSGKIQDTDLYEVKKIQHAPHSLIRIKYVVAPEEKKEDRGWYYRPIVHRDYFFFFGHCFFVVPKTDDLQEALVTLKWLDMPTTWTLANSFHVRQTQQELSIPVRTLLHAVFTGGNISNGKGKGSIVFQRCP